MNKYIKIKENIKVLNPIYESDVFTYQGDLDKLKGFDFEKQKQNYEKIKKIFGRYNIYFNKIWLGKFRNESNNIYSRFLLKSECGKVFWRKYSSLKPGSNQNFIYINGSKFKTTFILNLDQATLENFLFRN